MTRLVQSITAWLRHLRAAKVELVHGHTGNFPGYKNLGEIYAMQYVRR